MKALVLNGANDFLYINRPEPQVGAGCLLVKINAVCICGSDYHAIRGRMPLFSFPRVIGHEASGTVCAIGEGVTDFVPGDKVVLMPCIPCGICHACRKGNTNSCQSLQLYGVHTDGALAEYLVAPATNWLKVPDDMDSTALAMIEPLTIGAHATAKLNLAPGDRLLVIGSGPIGASCAANAQTYGAEVYMADTSHLRREFCTRTFGLPVYDPLSKEYMQIIQDTTKGELFDAVIDTTAYKQSMENAWRYIGQAGKIVFVGICGTTIELDGIGFHMKEPTLYVTRNSTRTDFERVSQFIRQGMLHPQKFITHKASFDSAAQEIINWADPASAVFKGVITF